MAAPVLPEVSQHTTTPQSPSDEHAEQAQRSGERHGGEEDPQTPAERAEVEELLDVDELVGRQLELEDARVDEEAADDNDQEATDSDGDDIGEDDDDGEDDLDDQITSSKKRYARKGTKSKVSKKGVQRVPVYGDTGKRSTLIVDPAAAKKRAEKAISDKALLNAVLIEIDNFFEAQDSAAVSHSSNNMVRRMKGSLAKSLNTFHATGNTDDQLPSKAAILATIYTHPQGSLNGDIGGTLSAMNRLDLAQPGPMQGAGPRTYSAFEMLWERDHEAIKAALATIKDKGADDDLIVKVSELEKAVNAKTEEARFTKAIANIKTAIQRKANTTDVEDRITKLEGSLKVANDAAKAADDAAKAATTALNEMRREVAKLKPSAVQRIERSVSLVTPEKRRSATTIPSPIKRLKTMAGATSQKKPARKDKQDDDLDFDNV